MTTTYIPPNEDGPHRSLLEISPEHSVLHCAELCPACSEWQVWQHERINGRGCQNPAWIQKCSGMLAGQRYDHAQAPPIEERMLGFLESCIADIPEGERDQRVSAALRVR